MAEEDWSRRSDEIEALSAIYAEQFRVSDEKSFTVEVDDGKSPPHFKLRIEVTLPCDYPSSSPPIYQISAPWLRGEERNRICSELESIYCDNLGESIIYMWVEKLREFLCSKSESDVSSSSTDTGSGNLVNAPDEHQTNSEDEGEDFIDEYGFDPKLHIYKSDRTENNFTTESPNELPMPVIHHGESIKDRKSIFQGHLASVTHRNQVKMVMDSLLESKKIADATHNIQAYRICQDGGVVMSGCEDDGETHAGSRMLHLMDIVDARNVLVVITRWYGGVHLGPDRFKHINNLTRQLLEQHGYIKDKNVDKKGPKSHSSQASQEDSSKPSQKHKNKNR